MMLNSVQLTHIRMMTPMDRFMFVDVQSSSCYKVPPPPRRALGDFMAQRCMLSKVSFKLAGELLFRITMRFRHKARRTSPHRISHMTKGINRVGFGGLF